MDNDNVKIQLRSTDKKGLITLTDKTDDENKRFSLRKRRNINYNLATKRFEFDRGDDSDYEEAPKKKKNNKKY